MNTFKKLESVHRDDLLNDLNQLFCSDGDTANYKNALRRGVWYHAIGLENMGGIDSTDTDFVLLATHLLELMDKIQGLHRLYAHR